MNNTNVLQTNHTIIENQAENFLYGFDKVNQVIYLVFLIPIIGLYIAFDSLVEILLMNCYLMTKCIKNPNNYSY